MSDDIYQKSLRFHEKYKGKISINSRVPLDSKHDLSLAYTPGVAQPCIEIHKNPQAVYKYTSKGNIVAVITDGSAVLGLGDIGPEASLPVMEGKAILFKKFADIDAFPICISTQDTDAFIETVVNISKSFGGINLEDISAPRCYEIENRLKEKLDIPVFHDDQHGTAVVVLAGLMNALKLTGKKFSELSVVINGAGAAGTAIANLLIQCGVIDLSVLDRVGIIYRGRKENMTSYKQALAETTNPHRKEGNLTEAIQNADVFIGVSQPNILSSQMVQSMAEDPIIFALANPVPEILPDEAKAAGARIVCTGRSDFPNQINNALVYPGIFRGALDVRAKQITEEMKITAAKSLAELVDEKDLTADFLIPTIFDSRIVPTIASAVAKAAQESGVAQI